MQLLLGVGAVEHLQTPDFFRLNIGLGAVKALGARKIAGSSFLRRPLKRPAPMVLPGIEGDADPSFSTAKEVT